MLSLFLQFIPSRQTRVNSCYSEFGAQNKIETSGSIFPPHPSRKGQIPTPEKGLSIQIPHSPGTENTLYQLV